MKKQIVKFVSLSSLVFLSLTGLSVNFNQGKLAFETTPQAQAQTACDTQIRNVSFTGRTSGSMTSKPNVNTNVRSNTTTSASILTTIPPNTMLTFTGWAYGQGITDIWTGRTDQRWFRVTYNGRTGWVASGVIYGNPPSAPLAPNCSTPPPVSTGFYQNPEVFYRWALTQIGIARLDRSDLKGQCVTLVARYVQEVKLPASQRTRIETYGHGKDTASVVASKFSAYFHPYTRSGLPRRGAVISFNTSHVYGHTGIVMASRYDSSGRRQVQILESNWNSGGVNSTVRISPWFYIDHNNNTVLKTARGWTNPR
jgi:hypothetical protein